MPAIAFNLPKGVLVYQANCPDCRGTFGVLCAEPPDALTPRFCPFCAGRVTFRLASHREVLPE